MAAHHAIEQRQAVTVAHRSRVIDIEQHRATITAHGIDIPHHLAHQRRTTRTPSAWTLREVPQHVRKLLALPAPDEGIDFIAQTHRGKYWAIQSIFRSQHDKPLTRKELGSTNGNEVAGVSPRLLFLVDRRVDRRAVRAPDRFGRKEIAADQMTSLNRSPRQGFRTIPKCRCLYPIALS